MKDPETITTIQELLQGRNEDFDRAAKVNKVKLVRQADNRHVMYIHDKLYENFNLYETYKHDKEAFLHYASEQGKPIYDNVDYIVMFLGERGTSARFLGVYKVNGKLNEKYTDCEYVYDITSVDDFKALEERVIIDWGKSTVSWHQYYNQVKPVVRIDEGMEDSDGIPYFKSYADINLSYEMLKKVISSGDKEWKTVLQAVNCIYMIVDRKTGKQYVGSTYSKDDQGGIWNRWKEYAETGHGGDKSLNELIKAHPDHAQYFNWIVLETLPLNITAKEAVKRENLYKEKFLTRLFGYNNN